jgi:acyl CoA:acetate/3-ketoacid CoA transferase alpha subunit
VAPGALIAFGGGLDIHLPCEAARRLVARADDIRLLANSSGYPVDLLIQHSLVSELHFAFCSLGDLGLAPAFRAAVEAGRLNLVEVDSPVLIAALRAASCGLPWMPMLYNGNDVRKMSPSYFVDLPVDQPGLVAVRAVTPDVLFLQAAYCDSAGNIYYRDTLVADYLLATASDHVVVCVEEIRDDKDVDPREAKIPAFLVDSIVVGERLGWPAAVPGYYESDREYLKTYIREAKASKLENR